MRRARETNSEYRTTILTGLVKYALPVDRPAELELHSARDSSPGEHKEPSDVLSDVLLSHGLTPQYHRRWRA